MGMEETMKRLLIPALILSIGLVLLIAPAVFAGGNTEAGKAVYDKKCATCHGKEGEGNAKMAAMLKVEIRHLGSKEVQGKTDEQLRKESTEGTGKMKPVKGLTDEEVTNLLAHLRTIKQK